MVQHGCLPSSYVATQVDYLNFHAIGGAVPQVRQHCNLPADITWLLLLQMAILAIENKQTEICS